MGWLKSILSTLFLAVCLEAPWTLLAADPAAEPLAWDAMSKDYTAKPGELTANFVFSVTNVSSGEVTINWVRPSCGCTVAKVPATPWKLAPGEHGQMEFSLDLRGKFGRITKYIAVDTSFGQKSLSINTTIPGGQQANAAGASGMDARVRNMQVAMADRQAIFKNDCVSCHVTPTIGRTGEQLFQTACGICHESSHRATMVPDLHALKTVPTRAYWEQWINNGSPRPGSLMPGFAQAGGGPLTPTQVESLVDYMTHYFPPRPQVTAATPTIDD